MKKIRTLLCAASIFILAACAGNNQSSLQDSPENKTNLTLEEFKDILAVNIAKEAPNYIKCEEVAILIGVKVNDVSDDYLAKNNQTREEFEAFIAESYKDQIGVEQKREFTNPETIHSMRVNNVEIFDEIVNASYDKIEYFHLENGCLRVEITKNYDGEEYYFSEEVNEYGYFTKYEDPSGAFLSAIYTPSNYNLLFGTTLQRTFYEQEA